MAEVRKNNNLNTFIEVPVLDEIAETKNKHLDSKGRVYATGRRKHASARLWLSIGNSEEDFTKFLNKYFKNDALVNYILQPLTAVSMYKVKVLCSVKGGGNSSQAGAIRLALSKALSLFDEGFRVILRAQGYLTTDSRRKEREHCGFRTSRKPQQYSRR